MQKQFVFFLLLCACISLQAIELPANYYARANGLQDGELKDSLKVIARGPIKTKSYGTGVNSTWGVFYYSDRDEEGYCIDMYCDSLYKFGAVGSAVTGCNIEHSFAKSWWGGNENDAYRDCYHLNPSNERANSARSNYPLGVPVKDFKSNTGSLKVGKMHHPTMDVDFWVFEPKDEYKGDFARAYFYMATCYGHWSDGRYDPVCSAYQGWRLDNKDVGSKFAMQNDNYLEFQPWEQEILLTWHRQDPVSIKEIRRMDAVSDAQKNRNPYIDYPYLVEYIWGDHAGEIVDFNNLMASSDEEFVPGVSNGWRDGGTTPVAKPKHGVTWYVNGEVLQVDSVYENKKIHAMPTGLSACSSESTEFMGWTTAAIEGTADEAPERLYKIVSEIPSVANDVSLYAVFAKKTVYDGGEPATYIYDDDNQAGWSTNATYGSYLLLDQGKMLLSPVVNLAGLSSIVVHIGTYGGKQYNTLKISANDEPLATIVTNTGSTETEYTWTNTGSLSGKAPIKFYTEYGKQQGIRIFSVVINATGTRIIYDRYITACQTTTEVELVETEQPARKVLIGGRIYVQRGEKVYTITGVPVK